MGALRRRVLAGVLVVAGCHARAADSPSAAASSLDPAMLRDGDLFFQESQSEQSRAILAATHGRYSQVGIAFMEHGVPVVFEAAGKVERTRWQAWVGRGAHGRVVVKRLHDANAVLTPEVVQKMRQLAEAFLGRPYDIAFGWDDERLYCSELAYKLYDRAAGVQVGALRPLRDYDLSAPVVQAKLHERYGKTLPLDTPMISPQAMFDDPKLETVFAN